MDWIIDDLEDWICDLLRDFITGNLTSMFTDVNEKTGTIANEVGQTPAGTQASSIWCEILVTTSSSRLQD